MGTTASLAATPRHRSSSGEATVRQPRARTACPPAPSATPQRREPTRLFHVPFASAMSDPDIAVLVRALDLVTHMHPKLNPSAASLGVVRLDFDSGMFLQRGPAKGRWILEGRTWGHPSPQAVRDWHLRAAGAAHRLDPTVTLPGGRTPAVSRPSGPPPGRVAHSTPPAWAGAC
jgi:hypothetical protein